MKSGIYNIHSLSNPTKIYIGSAVNLQARKKRHFRELAAGTHHNAILQRHYNKWGRADLKFEILSYCPEQYLIKEEQYWMNLLVTYFNVNPIADSRRGSKQTTAARLKISAASKAGKKENILSRFARYCGIKQ